MRSFNNSHRLILSQVFIILQTNCILLQFFLQHLIFSSYQLSAFRYAGQHSHPKQRGTNGPSEDGIEQHCNQLILIQDYAARLLFIHEVMLILGQLGPLSVTQLLLVSMRLIPCFLTLRLDHDLLYLFLLLFSFSVYLNYLDLLVFLHLHSRVIDELLLVFEFLIILIAHGGYFVVGLITPIVQLDNTGVSGIIAAGLPFLLISSACPRLDRMLGPTQLDLITNLDINQNVIFVADKIERIF